MALPTTVRTAINLTFGTPVVDPAVMTTLATRYSVVMLQSNFEVLANPPVDGPVDFSGYRQLALGLKAIRPALKTGYYVGAIGTPDVRFPSYWFLTDDDQLHKLDGSVVQILPDGLPGQRRMLTINYGRAATRTKLVALWGAWLAANAMDGVLFDIVNPVALAGFMVSLGVDPVLGALEGPVHTGLWWAQNLLAFLTELRAALPDKEIWLNGLDEPGTGVSGHPFDPANPTDALLGEEATRESIWASTALSEASYTIYRDAPKLAQYEAMAGRVAALGGSVFWFQQPVLWDFFYGSHAANQYPYVAGMDRFYLAAYLLVADERQYYGYHPYAPYIGNDPLSQQYVFDGGADWDRDLGAALGGVLWSTSGATSVALREFEHAWVAVNPGTGSGAFTVVGTYRNWDPTTGELYVVSADTPSVAVPPKTGLLLFKQTQTVEGLHWSRRMRARLQHVAQDGAGNIQPNVAVQVYKTDGVTAFDQVMYTAASGGSVVTNPTRTDSLGRLTLYAPVGQRVRLTVAGLAGQYDSVFEPDPADLFLGTGPLSLSSAGVVDPVLTVQATTGGTTGNRLLTLLNADGTTALAAKVHGLAGVGSATTDTAVHVNRLRIGDINAQPRIFADLSDATGANRLLVQSSVTNGSSDLGVVVNGTGTRAALTLWGRSSTASSEAGRLYAETGVVGLESLATGGQTAKDIILAPNQVEALRLKPNGDICQLDGGHLTTDTAGFIYVASSAGPPTGVPTARTGLVPMAFDRSNSRLYAYLGGSWLKAQFS